MSMKFVFVIFLSSAVPGLAATVSFGGVKTAGNGCFGSEKLVTVNEQEGRFALPIRVRVNKAAETSFDRKTCNLRIPVKISSNKKVQLLNLSQVVRVVSYKGAEINTNLNFGFAGRSGAPLSFSAVTTEDEDSTIQILKQDGVIAESECGRDAMLTANLSALVKGNGAQAFLSTGTALVTIKVVDCDR